MFEKEAKKWVKEHTEIEYKASYGEFPKEPSAIKSFKAGAEFGYNKANEWHYVKDGEYPSKHLESYVVAFYSAKGSIAKGKPCWEELCWDAEFSRWVDKETFEDLPYVNTEGIVIAWKEIVLPKESE